MTISTHDAAVIARWVYGTADLDLSDKWQPLVFKNDARFDSAYNIFYHGANGYAGAALRNIDTGEVIITHRGTEVTDVRDLITDGLLPIAVNQQKASAEAFYNLVQAKINAEYPGDSTITEHVGHSLGGNIAMLMASEHNQAANAFNAPGTAHFKNFKANSNIVNYVNPNDWIASAMPQAEKKELVLC